MGQRIQFGDEVGEITDRMCLGCRSYVYINVAMDWWDKYAVWIFLCLTCDERLLPCECETQEMIDRRALFVAELERTRFSRAQERAMEVKKEREEEAQYTLW